jgi:large subunit ribosomal protein L32e
MVMLRKSHPKFNVPNFGAKGFKRVQDKWKKQRGIDNKKRVMKQGYGASPSIGYKNPVSVRYSRPDGAREMLVHNEKELRAVPKGDAFVAVLAHDVSVRKKAALKKIADESGIRVANKK